MPRTTEAVKRSRSVSRLKKEFSDLGVDMTGTDDAKFANTPNKRKNREKSRENAKKAKMDVEGGSDQTRYIIGVFFGKTPTSIIFNCVFFFNKKKLFLIFRIRSMSRDKSGVRDPEQRKKIKKMDKKMQKKTFAKMGKAGESDRHIAVKMPRHLFSGKRGSGKTDRR